MNIRIANEKDLTVLHHILVQAAKRIAQMGSNQWADLLMSDPEELILPHILKNEVYVGELKNELVIMAFIMRNEEWDRNLWQRNKMVNDALYLHKLAVRKGFEGKGISQKFLKALELELVRLNEDVVLRLDCLSEKESLNKLYQLAGFRYVGFYEGEITNGNRFNLYEKHMKTSC